MNNTNTNKSKLLKKITALIKRKSSINILTVLLKVATLVLIILTFFSLLESYSYFNTDMKVILLFGGLLSSLIIFLYLAFNPFLHLINSSRIEQIYRAAKEIGSKFPNINDKLLNTLQLITHDSNYHSKTLVEAAFNDVYEKVKKMNFSAVIDYEPMKKHLTILLITSLSIISLFSLFPTLKYGALRLIAFNENFEKPRDFILTSVTGNLRINKGENVNLTFNAVGKIPEEVIVSTKSVSDSEYNQFRVKRDSNSTFNYLIRNIKNSFSYFAFNKDAITDTFQISVSSPPEINKITFEIVPPKYSGLPIVQRENNGNITALKGTRVNFNLTASKPLSSAKKINKRASEDTLKVSGNKSSGTLTVLQNEEYYFEIIDLEENLNQNPIEYQIEVKEDEFPQIRVNKPDQISLIPNNDIITIDYQIKDDFGFTNVELKYKTGNTIDGENSNEYNSIKLKFDKQRIEQLLFHNWELTELGLRENDIVTFFIEVTDNDYISGPKSGRTSLYKLRVPTLDEMYAEAEELQKSALEELTETFQDAEKLQKDFQEISNDLKQNEKEINWNEKELISEKLKIFEEMTNKIENVKEKLNEMGNKLAQNDLLSKETMDKYNELQKLIDEIDNEQLKKALSQMQNSLENLLRDKVQESLENLALNEEMFKRSIERTLNLLKKIQIEQNIDEIIKRTEKLEEDIKEVAKKTEKFKNDEILKEELIKDQESIERQLDNLEKEMKNLENQMTETDNMPKDEMKKINEEFEEQMNHELSNEAKEQLKNQNPSEALKNQDMLSQNMNSLQQSMKNMQQQMQQQSQQLVMQNMLKAIDNTISLSKDQENLNKDTEKIRSQPRDLPKMALPQMDLMQGLESILKQLNDLSQNTFAITPEMGQSLGSARKNMMESIAGMQDHNTQRSTFNQSEAVKNLNEAASMLQNSLQAMMQGGGQGGGMMSLMQQLQKMAQQQMNINKMTQSLQKGSLSIEQQAQLQRLAQQQAAVQKSLNELNKEAREAGESKKLAANLDQILEEMKEVISGMNTQQIDNNLIDKQDKILSKLLDAQRSINERDFETNRESISGKEFNLNSPAQIILNESEAADILRQELLRSFQSGFSKDYEDIIRKYFENLNEKKLQKN